MDTLPELMARGEGVPWMTSPMVEQAGRRTGEDIVRHRKQSEMILAHLRTGAPLTQDQARELFGCMRLASRISDLKKAGHVILSLRGPGGTATYLMIGGER